MRGYDERPFHRGKVGVGVQGCFDIVSLYHAIVKKYVHYETFLCKGRCKVSQNTKVKRKMVPLFVEQQKESTVNSFLAVFL